MPTLLNYIGYNQPYFAFGKDLFNEREDKIAISYAGYVFQLIWDNWVIQHDASKTLSFFDWSIDPLLKHNLIGENDTIQAKMERKVKAFIQQHNNRMADNLLLPVR